MKKNSFSVLMAIVALLISGCQSKPRPRPDSSSSRPTSDSTSEATSEVSSSQQSSSLGTSEISDVTVPTSIVSSSATSSWAPTSEGTSEHQASASSSIATSAASSLPTSAGTSATSDVTSVGTSATSDVTSAGTSATSQATSTVTSVITSASAPTTSFTSATAPITSATSDLATSGTSSSIPTGYYAACEGLSGSALQNKLYSINQPENPSYDWSRYEDADEAEDDPNSILCLYTRHNIPKKNHCGSYAWDKWNREHIWTQSKWPASDKDNHNIFACEGQINNYRGNLIFDEGGTTVTVFGHTTGCKMIKNTSFEPCDEAKGEVARSVMYGTVTYKYTMTNEIQSIALALKWHREHPVTSREIKRNEIVYRNQGNRNPFVDHPEYAELIWGNAK